MSKASKVLRILAIIFLGVAVVLAAAPIIRTQLFPPDPADSLGEGIGLAIVLILEIVFFWIGAGVSALVSIILVSCSFRRSSVGGKVVSGIVLGTDLLIVIPLIISFAVSQFS